MAKKLSISIHTPTKGATKTYPYGFTITGISIHTPTKGATLLDTPCYKILFDFNPHSHEGSDDTRDHPLEICLNFNPHSHEGSDGYQILGNALIIGISIHTPTKGATAILTNNFLIFCSISLINFILYLQIIQILFIFRYKFIFYFIF